MKQIIIAMLTVIILTTADSKAIAGSCKNTNYMIESSSDKINNIYIIKFEVSERGMVSVIITDEIQNEIIILAEGEMETGFYTVYYKPSEDFSIKYHCIMKVYTSGSNYPVFEDSIILK